MKEIVIDTQEPPKPKPCELCGVDDGKTQLYCGGFASWMHEKCGRIGSKAIDLYLRRRAFELNGLQYLVYDVMEVVEKTMKEQGFKKVDGVWMKKLCVEDAKNHE